MDIGAVRAEYPILDRTVYGRPLIYLDNAATTQVPRQILKKITGYYTEYHSNVHRGAHYLSEIATMQVEDIRRKTAKWVGAGNENEIIFTGGATHALNLAACSLERCVVSAGDNVIVSGMEHHSNFIPWQALCARCGAELRIIPVTEWGELDLEDYARLLDERTRLVAVTAVSNVLGTVNPVKQIAAQAHDAGAYILIDGAQYLRHGHLDMQDIDCDLFCFSAHKMMGPTGIGVLYAKQALLEHMQPSAFGGGMVDEVGDFRSSFAEGPARFEPGTPNIAGIIGLGAAMDYLDSLGREELAAREDDLLKLLEERLRRVPDVTIYGAPEHRGGAVSFNLYGVHPSDTAGLLDRLGIAVRAGHHCAQPLMRRLGITGTVRVSPAFYNTEEEIDTFAAALETVWKVEGKSRGQHS